MLYYQEQHHAHGERSLFFMVSVGLARHSSQLNLQESIRRFSLQFSGLMDLHIPAFNKALPASQVDFPKVKYPK
jgi:hypothetical protein